MFKTIEDALMVAWGHKNVEFGSVWHPLKVVNISPPQHVAPRLISVFCRQSVGSQAHINIYNDTLLNKLSVISEWCDAIGIQSRSLICEMEPTVSAPHELLISQRRSIFSLI